MKGEKFLANSFVVPFTAKCGKLADSLLSFLLFAIFDFQR